MNFCVVSYFVLFVLAQITWAQYTLEEQNLQQEYLNPANHLESEEQSKDQDKRTIFPSTINNYGWAKHIGINTSGGKYVLGYSPVDLKYVPVVRPISARPMYQLRPKWRPVMLKPANKPQQGGWKPIYKPPVYGPPAKPPTQEVGGGSDVFLQLPVKPAVPFKPVVPVAPVKPIVPVTPLKPVYPVPVTPLQPIVPSAPLPPPLSPASPILFHVTRPNLPVLPLGATFPSPILQSTALKPFVLPQPLPPPPPPPPAFTSVEFHGNHNYVRPALATVSPTPVFPAYPAPVPPPQFIPSPSPLYPQIPYQGELPHQTPNVALEQHDVQTPQTHQHLYQQDFQPIVSPQQLYPQEYQQEQTFQGIQPGQTDLQIPLHLPTHPHFRPVDLPSFQQSDFQTPFQTNANVVRPSIGLEPPFQRRREDVKVDENTEAEEDYEEGEEVLNKHK